MGRNQQLPRPGPRPGPPGDDTGCTILHVDMDAFFVGVALRSRPELKGKPVVVGGVGGRGVVSSASYEARAFGVHSAMPTAHARRLCPKAVFLPVDGAGVREVSQAVMAVFGEVTPEVEPLSVDEAFLDVSGSIRRMGSPATIAAWIRDRVAAEQGITCSVGVAPTKFVAKLASSQCKPNGLLVVPANEILDFLHPLPVGVLWGVGERTETILVRHGLYTVGDIARMPPLALRKAVGEAAGRHLYELANGRDPRRVTPAEPDRSIGNEQTYETDLTAHDRVRRELLHLSGKVASRLRAGGQLGRTVNIKIKFSDFRVVNRSRTLPGGTDTGKEIYTVAWELYESLGLTDPHIRLVGVRMEGIESAAGASHQLTFDEPDHGWRDAEGVVDAAVKKFGAGVIRPATLLDPRSDESPREPR